MTRRLTVSLGTFRRSTSTSAERSTRAVHIENCLIREGGEIQGRNYCGEQIRIYVDETKPGEELWKDDPEKIGAVSEPCEELWEAALSEERRFGTPPPPNN